MAAKSGILSVRIAGCMPGFSAVRGISNGGAETTGMTVSEDGKS